MTAASRNALERALEPHGLRLRGGWIPTPQDVLPGLPQGAAAAVVWMVGQVGSACWEAFSGSRFLADGRPDPLDRWSKSIGDALAQAHGGVAVYPSDGPPYAPFQQWARRAEPQLQASPKAMDWLKGLPLPGNIRQLKNLVERAVLVSGRDQLEIADFEAQLVDAPRRVGNVELPAVGVMTLEEMEAEMIRKAMAHHRNHITRVAKSLGLTRSSLYRRLEKYGIPYEDTD